MDDTESCIDDRCPTIWGSTSSRPRDALYEAIPQLRTRSRQHDIPRTLPGISQSVASAEDGRVKPIEGALLRKLFQATMDEKRKAEEKDRAARQAFQQHAEDLAKALDEVAVSTRFYVPNTAIHNAEGSDGGREKKIKPAKDKKTGRKGKKTMEPADPVANDDRAASSQDWPASEGLRNEKRGSVERPGQESEVVTASRGRLKGEKEPTPHPEQHKKEGKLSKREKKKLKQAEKERMKAAGDAEEHEAFMSGGLPAHQSETDANPLEAEEPDEVEYAPDEEEAAAPRSGSQSRTIHLQPTVESVASSRSSGYKDASKPHSTRSAPHNNIFPRATSVEKPASFVSWEEVGQGVVGEEVVQIASRIASSKHSSNATSNHQFEGFDQVLETPIVEAINSERQSSRGESNVYSTRTSKRRERETHSRSHVSQRSYSPAPRPSQILMEHEDPRDDPWQQEEPVEPTSKASIRQSGTASVNNRARETDPWTQGVIPTVISKHNSSRHSLKTLWPVSFEEVGQGWTQATSEAPVSRLSVLSSRSKPSQFNSNRTASPVWSQSGSEKVDASKVSTYRSATGPSKEIGEGCQGQDEVEIVARSRQTSFRSREVSSYAWNANLQDNERSNISVSKDRPGKTSQQSAEVDEPRSAARFTQSTKNSHKINECNKPLDAARPTVFAGKGWISPHPLSRSPTEMASPPQSKIVLPSEAFPHGATMSYDQWREMQEEGLRRNISLTESHMTINARRAHSRHRFAGWGTHSSDGHRFEEVSPEAEDSVSGPASYSVPRMDSGRSSGSLLSDERPPTGYTGEEHGHEPSWVGTWEEQHPVQSSERSGRHSRVQTLSQWSHEQSGSKQTHHQSDAADSGRSHDSSKASSRHDSSRSAYQSSRQTSRHSKSNHSSRHSSERNIHPSDRRSGSAQSPKQSIGWGRFSLGTVRSRQSQQNGGRDSRRNSHHTPRHALSARRKSGSDDWQGSGHSSGEGTEHTRHSSLRESRHSEQRSVSAQSHGRSNAWGYPSNMSRHSQDERSHPTIRTIHHVLSTQTRSETASAHNSSQDSMSSSDGVMEVMEEGRNVWSDVPQYDGTMSNQEPIERSDISMPTSQLYWKRYRGNGDEESGVERRD